MGSKLKLSRSLEFISAFFKAQQEINTPPHTTQIHIEILITTYRQIQETTFPLKVRNQPYQLIKLRLAEDVKAHFIDLLK